jgi:hypothetical protein
LVALTAAACGGGTLSPDGGSPGMCSANVPAGQECNTLQNMATPLTPTCATGTAPAGTGGTIADGTYVLTSTQDYGTDCATDLPVAETIAIAGDCIQSVFGDILAGTTSGRLATQGSSITFTRTCLHLDIDGAVTTQDSATNTYTATSTTFTLVGTNATTGNSSVAVFTRR